MQWCAALLRIREKNLNRVCGNNQILRCVVVRWVKHWNWIMIPRVFLYRYREPNRRAPVLVYRFGSTGNRRNSNLNSKSLFNRFRSVYRPVRPVYRSGSTGNRSLKQKIESVENLTCFQVWNKKWKNIRNFSKNIARCIESNGIKRFQILVHLVFFGAWEVQPAIFLLFLF
jgi:hypothetical protein